MINCEYNMRSKKEKGQIKKKKKKKKKKNRWYVEIEVLQNERKYNLEREVNYPF